MTDLEPLTVARSARTVLQKIRDIALTVMAMLVSVLCAILLYVLFAAGSSLAELGDRATDPAPTFNFDSDPVPTNSAGEECIGEVVPAGC